MALQGSSLPATRSLVSAQGPSTAPRLSPSQAQLPLWLTSSTPQSPPLRTAPGGRVAPFHHKAASQSVNVGPGYLEGHLARPQSLPDRAHMALTSPGGANPLPDWPSSPHACQRGASSLLCVFVNT